MKTKRFPIVVASPRDAQVSESGWWYLSFVAGEGFRGACVVEGVDVLNAVWRAKRIGIDTTGEVLGVPVPIGKLPSIEHRNRLLSREDIDGIWNDAMTLGEYEAKHGSINADRTIKVG